MGCEVFGRVLAIILRPSPWALVNEQIFIRPTLTELWSHLSVVAELGCCQHCDVLYYHHRLVLASITHHKPLLPLQGGCYLG